MTQDGWTDAMRAYDLRARIRPHVRAFLDGMEDGEEVDAGRVCSAIAMPEGFSEDDKDSAVASILESECSDGGMLRMADGAMVRVRAPVSQARARDPEFFACCVMCAILLAMDACVHIWALGPPGFREGAGILGIATCDMMAMCGPLLLVLYHIWAAGPGRGSA